jgi:hypothetical protein
VYPAVNASALPTANLDFIGLNFGAIFETKPAPALAVGIQFIGSTADFTSAVNYLRGEGAQSIPPDIKKIMEDSNLWGENIDEDFMNSIEETDFAMPKILSLSNGGVSFGNEFVR